MFEKEYKEEANRIPFSEDFESRTLKRLKANHRVPRRRSLVRTLAPFAAVLILAVVLYSQRSLLKAANPPDINEVETMIAATLPHQDPIVYEDDIVYSSEADTDDMAPVSGGALTAINRSLSRSEESESSVVYYPEAEFEPAEEINTSEYAYIAENGFQASARTPLSTFAADVDTASYANVRGMLLRGNKPSPDAVRIEEMINYFHYDYPAPKDGEPFSVQTQIAPCPWNDKTHLLRIGVSTETVDTAALPPSNLVFLIDVSGSMDEPDKLPLCQRAFTLLTEQLSENDTVSIVTYAGSDRVVLDGVSGYKKSTIRNAIESLMAGGSTAGAKGIETAYEIAQKHFIDGGNNRVILATDGDLNVGISSESELTRLIEEKKTSGVYLSVMGFGYDNLKDNRLEALADHGNGNYSYIDSVHEAKKVLIEEMGATLNTVAKDVKLQVEFNPEKVSEYRLIGYENRALSDRDFADDTKDGGEIGAGHAVTALYELKLADGEASGDDALRYQANSSTGLDEYLMVSIRAKAPDGDTSREYNYPVGKEAVLETMPDDFAFAAAVAEFGMLLRDSEYKGSSSYEGILDMLKGIDDLRDDVYKDEFEYLVQTLARGE